MRLSLVSLFVFASLVASTACTGRVDEATASGEDAVTGVTDLGAVEAELGFVKDVQDAHGAWSRPESKLRSGPCYKSTVGGPNGASFEFRRYRQGAAFFAKRGTAAMTGDERPVRCIDVDVTPLANEPPPGVVALSGVALDSAMRYHLGKPTGWDAGLSHRYLDFERGVAEIKDPGNYCGIFGESGEHSPGPEAFAHELTTCTEHGGSQDACTQRAEDACEKAVSADLQVDSIDRPAFTAGDTSPSTYFVDLELPVSDGSLAYTSGSLISAVYRYARKVAAGHDAFTLAGDPVGAFTKLEWVDGQVDGEYAEHARFDHLDAHVVVREGIERLAITPKGSDDHIVENAVVLCTRTVGFGNMPTSRFQCRGL